VRYIPLSGRGGAQLLWTLLWPCASILTAHEGVAEATLMSGSCLAVSAGSRAKLLARIGDGLALHLLVHTSGFCLLGRGNYFQLWGVSVAEVRCPCHVP